LAPAASEASRWQRVGVGPRRAIRNADQVILNSSLFDNR
jgi:hypothetical protein